MPPSVLSRATPVPGISTHRAYGRVAPPLPDKQPPRQRRPPGWPPIVNRYRIRYAIKVYLSFSFKHLSAPPAQRTGQKRGRFTVSPSLIIILYLTLLTNQTLCPNGNISLQTQYGGRLQTKRQGPRPYPSRTN